MYYTYMIRCKDNSIYTGITTNIERRMEEHIKKEEKCAKYTARHTVENIEAVWTSSNRVLASKLEYHIKKLPKPKKEKLIQEEKSFEKLLQNKIECNEYIRKTEYNKKKL